MLPTTSCTRRHTRLKRRQVVPVYQSGSKARRWAPVAQQSANRLFGPVHDLLGRMSRCGALVDREAYVVNRIGPRLEGAADGGSPTCPDAPVQRQWRARFSKPDPHSRPHAAWIWSGAAFGPRDEGIAGRVAPRSRPKGFCAYLAEISDAPEDARPVR